jgi:hypothetical protein
MSEMMSAGDFDRAVLDELGEKYELRDIPLEDIDVDESARVLNQVRLGAGAVNAENVEKLRTVLEQGGELPPGIAHKDDRGRYVILSGNHRFPAHKQAGRPSMMFYVPAALEGVATADPLAQDVALRANVGHGDPVPTTARIEQATRLVESGHYTVKEASRALAVPEGKLRDSVEKAKSRRRLAEAGVALSDRDIPISVARRLNAIGSDNVLREAARLVPLMAQKAEETNQLVVAVNAARTEDQQLAIVREAEQALNASGATKARARGRKGATLVDSKTRRVEGALTVIARYDVSVLDPGGLPKDFRELFESKVAGAVETLSALQAKLGTP